MDLTPVSKSEQTAFSGGVPGRVSFTDMTNRANPTTEVFPDKPGPVIRNSLDGERELINLTWGMPSPPSVTNGKPDYGVTINGNEIAVTIRLLVIICHSFPPRSGSHFGKVRETRI